MVRPQGGLVEFKLRKRGAHGVNSLFKYLKTKKGIVSHANTNDKLCMVSAICISKVAAQFGTDHPKLKAVRRLEKDQGLRSGRINLQKQRTISLHKEADVSLNKMVGMDDANAFQHILSKESIQLNIFSFHQMNFFIYLHLHFLEQKFISDFTRSIFPLFYHLQGYLAKVIIEKRVNLHLAN